MQLKVVKLGENGITEKNILIHDAKAQSPLIHWMLAKMNFQDSRWPLA